VPAKTNTDAIRDLEQLVVTLRERLDNTREETKRNREEQTKFAETQNDIRGRFIVVEEKLAELKKTAEESDRRRHQLLLLFAGSLLTLVANILVTMFRR